MNALLETAHVYAARGWPVLPLEGKRPYLSNGVLGASTYPAVINAWWRRWPEANVGVRTGKCSNLLVLDVDPKGFESLEKLEKKFEPLLTLKVRTGRGFHLYFRPAKPVDYRNKVGARPGLDVRANEGYVVAPPSQHETGKRYQWCSEDHPCPIVLPCWLELILFPPPAPFQKHVKVFPSTSTNEVSRYWLGKYLDRAVPGRRNVEGFYLACQLRDAGFSESEAEPIMAEYAGRVPGEDYTEQEALRSLRSAYSRSRRAPAGRWYIR